MELAGELDELVARLVLDLEDCVGEEVLDAGGVLLGGLDVLLDLNLAAQLGRELGIILGTAPTAGRGREGGRAGHGDG